MYTLFVSYRISAFDMRGFFVTVVVFAGGGVVVVKANEIFVLPIDYIYQYYVAVAIQKP